MNDLSDSDWLNSFRTQVHDGKLKSFSTDKLVNNLVKKKSDKKEGLSYDIASGGLGLGLTAMNPLIGATASIIPQIAKKAKFAGNMDMGYGKAGSPDQFNNPSEREDYYRSDSKSTAPPAQIIAPRLP
jgi:hypothetical protein